MVSLSEVLRRSAEFLEDSDRVLEVKHVLVDTWDDLVIEVKNTYANVKEIVLDDEPAGWRGPNPTYSVTDEYTEFVNVFGDAEPVPEKPVITEPTRDEKIAFIADYVVNVNGFRDTAWTNDPDSIRDELVETCYRLVQGNRERERQAKQSLNSNVDGDRFGPFNPRDYWNK